MKNYSDVKVLKCESVAEGKDGQLIDRLQDLLRYYNGRYGYVHHKQWREILQISLMPEGEGEHAEVVFYADIQSANGGGDSATIMHEALFSGADYTTSELEPSEDEPALAATTRGYGGVKIPITITYCADDDPSILHERYGWVMSSFSCDGEGWQRIFFTLTAIGKTLEAIARYDGSIRISHDFNTLWRDPNIAFWIDLLF